MADMQENRDTVHIIHHNDLDGICAAAIMYVYLDEDECFNVHFYETNYNRLPDVHLMKPGDSVYIVDFSYPPKDMAVIEAAIYPSHVFDRIDEWDHDIIWIDHHKTAKAYGYKYDGLRDFTDFGMSGCELTWKWCFPDFAPPEAVRLIGDYDSWRLEMPSSKVFYEGAKLELLDPRAPLWSALLKITNEPAVVENTFVKMIHGWGKNAVKYRDNYTAGMRKSYGYATVLPEYPGAATAINAYALNLYGFGSQQFGELFEKYPLVIAYVHDGRKFTVSLYSVNIDVGKIAKAYGGGGHTGAAGFVCNELPFHPDLSLVYCHGGNNA